MSWAPRSVGAGGPGRAEQDRALTAGKTGAIDRGHPQVGGAGVKDDGELLGRGSDANGAEILHLWGGDSTAHGPGPPHLGFPQGPSLRWVPSPPPTFPLTVLLAFLCLSYASILQGPAWSPLLLEVFPDCSPVSR